MCVTIPETSLSSLTAHVRSRLGARGGVRTLGPRDMRVRTVLLSPGTTDMATTMAGLKNADVVIAGEPREWEVVPYVLDAREAGAAKALIAVGRIVSEEPGMRACAAWIRTLAPGLRVEALPVADPFWNPAVMTAQEIVARIRQQLAAQGITWRTETVDTFKAGDPDTPVAGIATTGMATFPVLKRAAKANRNFVITHEPTFYNHQDQTTALDAGCDLRGQAAVHQGESPRRLAVPRSRARDSAGSAGGGLGAGARLDGVRVAHRAAHLHRAADHARRARGATSPAA